MNLYVICDIIQNAGIATMGTDLFTNHMPDTVSNGVLLRLPMAGIDINHYTPGFFKGSVQVIVRSTTYGPGRDRATALQKALEIYNQDFVDASGNLLMSINYLRPRTLPVVYPRTPGNSIEWSINFDACYVLGV